jgi:hypothetical protein
MFFRTERTPELAATSQLPTQTSYEISATGEPSASALRPDAEASSERPATAPLAYNPGDVYRMLNPETSYHIRDFRDLSVQKEFLVRLESTFHALCTAFVLVGAPLPLETASSSELNPWSVAYNLAFGLDEDTKKPFLGVYRSGALCELSPQQYSFRNYYKLNDI